MRALIPWHHPSASWPTSSSPSPTAPTWPPSAPPTPTPTSSTMPTPLPWPTPSPTSTPPPVHHHPAHHPDYPQFSSGFIFDLDTRPRWPSFRPGDHLFGQASMLHSSWPTMTPSPMPTSSPTPPTVTSVTTPPQLSQPNMPLTAPSHPGFATFASSGRFEPPTFPTPNSIFFDTSGAFSYNSMPFQSDSRRHHVPSSSTQYGNHTNSQFRQLLPHQYRHLHYLLPHQNTQPSKLHQNYDLTNAQRRLVDLLIHLLFRRYQFNPKHHPTLLNRNSPPWAPLPKSLRNQLTSYNNNSRSSSNLSVSNNNNNNFTRILLLHLQQLHYQPLQLQHPKPGQQKHLHPFHCLHLLLERLHHLFAFLRLHLS